MNIIEELRDKIRNLEKEEEERVKDLTKKRNELEKILKYSSQLNDLIEFFKFHVIEKEGTTIKQKKSCGVENIKFKYFIEREIGWRETILELPQEMTIPIYEALVKLHEDHLNYIKNLKDL